MNIQKSHDEKINGKPLILYELNEVPWRVIDWYVKRRPSSAFSHLLNSAAAFTTYTKDEGELHPWTTWPSLHRGVYNTSHNIRFINQDITEANIYPPIWKTLRDAGKKVGVFGSLQSYPPEQSGYAFYVPDTFSPGFQTVPDEYSSFQRFNLRQTQQDGAHASPLAVDPSIGLDILKMFGIGLSTTTCRSVALHIAKERANALYKTRRSVLQGLIAFDIFKYALKKTQPDFCTFFTNHVAGMMHRYWKHTFPEDFKYELNNGSDRFHADSIGFAMDVADMQLGYLLKYTESVQGTLMLASSMGQEAIDRGEYFGEWRIKNLLKFLSAIGWNSPVRNLMAMQPDFNFSFDSDIDAKSFLNLAAYLTDAEGIPIWKRCRQVRGTANLGLSPSKQALTSGEVTFSAPGKTPVKIKIADLGIEFLSRDPGTGYHQPYGVLLLHGAGVHHNDSRLQIELTDVRPAIMEIMGVESQCENKNFLEGIAALR
jgi:hypothetical protein